MVAKTTYNTQVLLIGSEGSGKTSIVRSALKQPFNPVHTVTVGCDYYIRHYKPSDYLDICLDICDTSGAPRFQPLIIDSYYPTENAIFVYCVDLSTPINQETITKELALVREKSPDANIILVGTKCDKEQVVLPATLEALGEKLGCYRTYITSAKTGENIGSLFVAIDLLAGRLILQLIENLIPQVLALVAAESPLYDSLSDLFDNIAHLPDAQQRSIVNAAENLVWTLRDTTITPVDKHKAIANFQHECNHHLQGASSWLKTALKAVAVVAATAFVTLIAAMVGFGIGFAAGFWTGPGAFISGVMMGGAAAGTVVAGSGVLGVGAGALSGYSLFKPESTPQILAVAEAAKNYGMTTN